MLLYSTDCLKRNSKMKNKEQHTFPFIERLLDGAEVEWKPLGEVTKYEQPTTYLVKSANYDNAFTIPVLTAGKTFILGYTNETTGIYKASKSPVIIFDDFTTANKWVNFDFKVKSSAMKMVTSKNESKVLLRYIYHWLNTLPSEFTESDHKRQWISNFCYKKIPIPCPNNTKHSLAIQHRIVDILDKFTTLEAELEAELEGRKRQYEFYRNQLLSIDMLNGRGKKINNSTILPLGEIVTIKNGKDYKHLSTGNIPVYGSGGIMCFVDQYVYNKPSVLIPRKGSLANIFYLEEPFWNVDTIFYTEINEQIIIPKFLYYYLLNQHLDRLNLAGGVPSLTQKILNKIQISIPPLSEQQRIVSILDKFDTLTTSISEGLPKEIELRRKQYEFYRDKLLSFA